jgi:hypothetical protein
MAILHNVCTKTCTKAKQLKIKHLRGFLCICADAQKDPHKARRPAPPVGTIFAVKISFFLYIYAIAQ